MEKGEENAEESYKEMIEEIPEAASILKDEFEHENMLVEMLDEKKISYMAQWFLESMMP